MRRRDFITILGGAAAAWPLTARAQQPDRIRRIGFLTALAANDPDGSLRITAFQKGLQQLGWTEGRNIEINYRWTASDLNRMKSYAAELVTMKPDVILAMSPAVLEQLRQETHTIPIVFVQVTDPVGAGFVASLARPGGNITGFSSFEPELGTKWMELLKEIAPRVSRAAVILDPAFVGYVAIWRAIEAAAPAFGIQATAANVHNVADIERAIEAFARESNGGLIVLPTPVNAVHREPIITLAARHRLPAVYPYTYFARSGGLMSYGIDATDLYGRAAAYVDRILKGEKPADLPVQAPTKYELVINLKTAKALSLDVPPTLLARADAVIE